MRLVERRGQGTAWGLENPQNPQAGKLLCRKDLIALANKNLREISTTSPRPSPPNIRWRRGRSKMSRTSFAYGICRRYASNHEGFHRSAGKPGLHHGGSFGFLVSWLGLDAVSSHRGRGPGVIPSVLRYLKKKDGGYLKDFKFQHPISPGKSMPQETVSC